MKAACLLSLVPLLTMSCAMLMHGTSYAAPSQPTSAVSSANASDKNHPRSGANQAAANRPKQLPNSRKRSVPGNATHLRQPGSNKSGGAAKGELIQNETVNNARPVRPR